MNATPNFADRLSERILASESRVCVGCDPATKLFPPALKEMPNVLAAIEAFGYGLMDAVAPFAAALKFQSAFYERFGSAGICALEKQLARARDMGLIVILDVKRGDIGSTTQAYADAFLKPGVPQEADAITVAPYLGGDTLAPFTAMAAAHGKGFFALVKTSNPGAGDLQDLKVEGGGFVYERTAALVAAAGAELIGASGYSAAGAVVGATYPELLTKLRALMPRQYFLLPGVGAQGGDANLLGPAFDKHGLGGLVAASRSVAFAWSDYPDLTWELAAATAARKLRDDVNAMLAAR